MLPLRRGKPKTGEPVWFIPTDSTDAKPSDLHGLAYSLKLVCALTGRATRKATIQKDGGFTFATGKVDFCPSSPWRPRPSSTPCARARSRSRSSISRPKWTIGWSRRWRVPR